MIIVCNNISKNTLFSFCLQITHYTKNPQIMHKIINIMIEI